MNKANIGILWNQIKTKLPEFKYTLKEFEDMMSTVEDRKNFFEKKYSILNKKGIFLGKYADFEKKYGGDSPTPSKPDTVWSCIEKSDEKHGVTKTKLQPGQDSHQKMQIFSNGNKIIFYDDNKLKGLYNDAEHHELNGTWSCDGDSDYTIELETGAKFSSSNNKWILPEQKGKSVLKINLMEFQPKKDDFLFKNLIKKNIVEVKNKKDSLMIESKLIQSRLKFVLGDEKFNNLSEDKKVRVGFQLFEEIAILSNQGFMNEESLLDTFKGLFGKDVHSLPETFYMPWIDKVLKTLNMNDSYLKEYLIDQLTKTPTEVWNSFENCEKMTHMIAKALSETLIFHLRMDKDFSGLVGVRNSLEETMREEVFIKKIEDKIGDMICSSFNKYATNASNVLQKLKQ
jgi:hypothetical protein